MRYNVGDKVRIKSLDWYNENKDEFGNFDINEDFTFYADRSRYCGKVFTISEVFDNSYLVKEDNNEYYWTNEMFEGLVEEEIKPKFKVGDKVKWYNHTCNITSIDTDENTYTYLIKHDDYREDKTFAKWVPENELTFEDDEETYDFLKTDKPNRSSLNDFMDMLDNEIKLPIGYQFKDENGNVINATKIVLEKKKPEYPKTYEECCKVLGVSEFEYNHTGTKMWYRHKLMATLDNLMLCRDAYWKLYGEEMGLDKPWEPDWLSGEGYEVIVTVNGEIVLDTQFHINAILVFPTAEMRDAFYENFKKEIEMCKELL